MGRPPCCEKTGINKVPWMPEEDIILVSYIQEHGPGNWRSVSVNTGLKRNSQSCRLRWTNYLRPGIRRGNFTSREEAIIVQLQSLLGNRWAAIASYLPQRTDGDIKNYWYSHLKNKLNKQQAIIGGGAISAPPPILPPKPTITTSDHVDRHHYITTNPFSIDSYPSPASSTLAEVTQLTAQCSPIVTTNGYYSSSSSSYYASSMDSVPKLFNGFTESPPSLGDATADIMPFSAINNNPLFPFDLMTGGALAPPISDSDMPPLMPPQQQMSSIEDWLFDDAAEQVFQHQLMEISDGCLLPSSQFPMLL